MRFQCRRVALLCVWVSALCMLPLSANVSELLAPVALSPSRSGGLYALDKNRGLIYIPGATGLDLKNSTTVAEFRSSWQAVDMTAANVGSSDRVYVVLAQETIGMLLCYSDRHFERSWIAKTLLSGITADPVAHRLFIAGALTNEIYVFDWEEKGASPTKVFVPIHGSEILGPLAFDSDEGVLFAGDQRTGVIYAVNVNTKTVSTLTQIVGQPNALTFDRIHHMLYIADSVTRRIWAARVDVKPVKPKPFSSSADFRQPSALAIDASGTVWVGDQESRAVFRLNPNGAATAYRLFLHEGYTSQSKD